MTLVGSEKRQIRKCFMLISMEISLIYRRLLPSLACRAPAVSSVVALPGCSAARGSLLRLRRLYQLRPRALLPLLSLFFFFFLSATVLRFLSHDGFIGPPLLLILSNSFSCLAYQRRFVGHRAGTPHMKSSARWAPPRSFAALFLRDAGGCWVSSITRLVVKRHM